MTSDAKIGLLLGLVFIFIIAFVINGLPRFQNSMENSVTNAEENFVQGDPIGWRERNSLASDEQNYPESTATVPVPNEEEGTEFALNNNPWAATDHATVLDNRPNYYSGQDYLNQGSESSVRYSTLLDDSSTSTSENEADTPNAAVADNSTDNERLRIDLTTAVASREVPLEGSNNRAENNTNGRPNNPFGGNGFQGMNNGFRPGGRGQWNAQGQQNGMGGQGGFAPQTTNPRPEGNQTGNNTPRPFQMPSTQTGSTFNTNTQNRERPNVQSTQQNQTFKVQTYTIQEGDNNLSKIAKKFYGEEEGNRLVNINKIFDANKETLKSPDKIFVGQKIVIPQPAPPIKPQPSDVLQGGMFRNVPSVGGGSANRTNDNPKPNTGRVYVVKEDDSLWKIAANELGNGTRYEEISKLNSDILTNENKLKLGMKLRLPAK